MNRIPCCTALLFTMAAALPAAEIGQPAKTGMTPVSTLEASAHARVGAKARLPLPAEASEMFRNVEPVVASDKGHVPNYARALAALDGAPRLFANVFRTFLYEGTVQPETKMAMALRMAQLNGSPYTAAHITRLMRTSEEGKALLEALNSNRLSSLSEADQLALTYAEALTKEIHGLNDAEFQKVGAVYNDSQVVELTFTVSLFNYFTRFVEALNLPVEPWALEVPSATAAKWVRPPSRVGLVSDAQIALTNEFADAARKAPGNLGEGVVANSIRAMVQVPAQARAFRDYAFNTRADDVVSRETKLQVSFAVSMANGCRYCTLHQVLGLRKLGVNMNKLVAMKKDDSALTPKELVAVTFARKLTAEPSGITDQEFGVLRTEFGERGSLEVLLSTTLFAFMNRFTDGLRMPSEDTAIQYYRETYGADFGK